MTDIINIDLKSPYFRPNYNYIVDLMDKEGAVVLVHERAEIIKIQGSIKHTVFQIGSARISEDTWKVYLKKKKKESSIGNQYDLENLHEIYSEKLKPVKKGKKVSFLNRGQAVFFMGVYKKYCPEELRKFKMEKNDSGYSLWLEGKKKTVLRGYQYDLENLNEIYSEKLKPVKKGNKVSFLNRGQAVSFIGIYKKYCPEELRKFKMEKNDSGYSLWLEEIS